MEVKNGYKILVEESEVKRFLGSSMCPFEKNIKFPFQEIHIILRC